MRLKKYFGFRSPVGPHPNPLPNGEGTSRRPRHPASINLSVKLTLCLIGGMVIIFSVLGYKIIRLHRENLEEATYADGDRITETIKRSTRYGMLHNRSDEINQIVTSIGSQPGIEKISIFNKAGEIKSSTDERELLTRVDKNAEACSACHAREGQAAQVSCSDSASTQPAEPHAHFFRRRRTPNPECYQSDRERTGLFELRLSRAFRRHKSSGNDQCADVARHRGYGHQRKPAPDVDQPDRGGRAVVGYDSPRLIWLMVHKPIRQLIVGTNHVAAGELDYKISLNVA